MSNKIVEALRTKTGGKIDFVPSPVTQWIGATLRDVSEGELTAEIIVRDDMLNLYGTVHGGVISMIMDDIIGATVYTLNRPFVFVSVNLNVDFLSNVTVGKTMTAKAKVVRKGRTLIHVECLLLNHRNHIIAKGNSNMIITKVPMNEQLFT